MELPTGVTPVRSKGKVYWYFRPNRKAAAKGRENLISHRLPDDPSSPEFWSELERIGVLGDRRSPFVNEAGTVGHLIEAYRKSPEYRKLSENTQRDYDRYLDRFHAMWGERKALKIKPKHVLELRDAYVDTPRAANYMIRVLSLLLKWGVPREYLPDNPCRNVALFPKGDPYDAWHWEEVEEFRDKALPEHWWAVAIAVYTGQRQGDCLKMTWRHIRDGMVHVRQDKTRKLLRITLHRELKDVLEQIPRRAVQILTNTRSEPWQSGFRASFYKELHADKFASMHQAAKAEDRHLVFHGLRKTAVVNLLEAECTTADVAAVTGQSIQMVEHYAIQVNQKKLARSAILKLERKDRT